MSKGYKVEVVDGVQAVNGGLVESVIDPREKRCLVCNPDDPQRLAEQSFAAGRITERVERRQEATDLPLEFVDDAAVVYPVDPPQPRRRRR